MTHRGGGKKEKVFGKEKKKVGKYNGGLIFKHTNGVKERGRAGDGGGRGKGEWSKAQGPLRSTQKTQDLSFPGDLFEYEH